MTLEIISVAASLLGVAVSAALLYRSVLEERKQARLQFEKEHDRLLAEMRRIKTFWDENLHEAAISRDSEIVQHYSEFLKDLAAARQKLETQQNSRNSSLTREER